MRASALVVLLCATTPLLALKTGDWKKCADSAFCRRGRALAARAQEAGSSWRSPYSVDASSLTIGDADASLSAAVKSSIYPDIKFNLDLQVLDDGVVRVRMDEVDGLRKRYDEAASWSLISEPRTNKDVRWTIGKKNAQASYGDISVLVDFEPLKISMLRKGKEEIVMNGGGLLHMEHFRTKRETLPDSEAAPEGDAAQQVLEEVNPAAWFEGEEDGWWEEQFKSWKDTKPKGTSHSSKSEAHSDVY